MRFLETQLRTKWHTDYILIVGIQGTQPVTFWIPAGSWMVRNAVERQTRIIAEQAMKQGIKMSEVDMRNALSVVLIAVEMWGPEIFDRVKDHKARRGKNKKGENDNG